MNLPNGPKLKIGACTVDPALDAISRDGNEVKVEPRAMRMLLYLAEHAGEVVSVEKLLANVWPDLVVTPDSVYTAIAALRRALEDDSKEPRYIVNVPRRGYRLVASVEGNWVSKQDVGAAVSSAQAVARSIAVLPFADMSEKKDQEYFADGMAEEVRNLLAKVPAARVIGRTSSFQFRRTTEDLRTVGMTLGAAYLVEGSVRRSGDRLRVTAQLIDARDGTNRWSETYDRPAGDVLQLQDEIAASLAHALEIGVGADRHQSRRRPNSDEAYDLYLRGRYAEAREDAAGLAAAVSYLRQSLSVDPEFVDAMVALAETYYLQATNGLVPTSPAYELAFRAAHSALKLDADVGLAHAILGAIHCDYDRNWEAADREFKRAVSLAPRDGVVLRLAAQLPLALGQDAAARRMYEESLVYDPLLPDSFQLLAWVELRSGRFEEAEVAARRAIDISPCDAWGHFFLGMTLLLRGEHGAALAEVKRETHPSVRLGGLAIVYHALGRKIESDAAMNSLATDGADVPTDVARAYSFRGDINDAFKWLDRARTGKDPGLCLIKRDPFFASLEADHRFKTFLKQINLPE